VLTGGVAEGSATVRASATGALSWLGVELAHDLNADAAGIQDVADLTAPSSASRVLLVAAREDVEIARQTVKILTGDPAGRTTT
ncbi:MAG: acetate/propionate family kinase, partial [Actinomycetota bacterium]|nr:acetate/propionate family kinase [Actinomycetota bacterium]